MAKKNKFTIVDSDHVFDIPSDIAVCPICKGKLKAYFEGWTKDDNGLWMGEFVHLDCEHEPEWDSNHNEWNEWFDWHYREPYIDWLPVCILVEKWINERYRFKL